MKTIKLTNNKTYETSDYSTIENLTINLTKIEDVIDLYKQLSSENLKNVIFADKEYLNVTLTSLVIEANNTDIIANVNLKVETELEAMKRQIAELQQAMLEEEN